MGQFLRKEDSQRSFALNKRSRNVAVLALCRISQQDSQTVRQEEEEDKKKTCLLQIAVKPEQPKCWPINSPALELYDSRARAGSYSAREPFRALASFACVISARANERLIGNTARPCSSSFSISPIDGSSGDCVGTVAVAKSHLMGRPRERSILLLFFFLAPN